MLLSLCGGKHRPNWYPSNDIPLRAIIDVTYMWKVLCVMVNELRKPVCSYAILCYHHCCVSFVNIVCAVVRTRVDEYNLCPTYLLNKLHFIQSWIDLVLSAPKWRWWVQIHWKIFSGYVAGGSLIHQWYNLPFTCGICTGLNIWYKWSFAGD